ncbi:MAG: FAD-dependent oxidoreductase [Proteobacteria bacterium]|nr:FAD-dependent oxidoreductase [Pseudomonadota bacterium]
MSAGPTASGSAGPVSIAIVGAGPGGFYTAAAVLKSGLEAEIDIIDALPTPFGLIRGGVAPDHQSTKGVWRAFARTAERPQVRYYGNIKVGRDLSVAELRARYDAVVLATGMGLDRKLAIPGADLAGVYGAAAFVGWYNGHPDFRDLDPDLDTPAVCIIGNGNVAIDVARVLVKTPAEMATSDLADHAAQAIHAAPIRDVYIIGRRGPAQAKFTNKELGEMGALEDCAALVDPAQLPAAVAGEMSDRDRRQREKNLATLRSFPSAPEPAKGKCVHFVFFAQPEAISGAVRCAGLRLERTRLEDDRAVGTGETFEIPCGVVVFAVGYRMDSLDGVPGDERAGTFESRDGRVADGLYVVGWAKRGPSGVIGTNKGDGDLAAEQIRADIPPGRKAGRAALESLLTERRLRWVSFADWQRIDAAETAAAPEAAPRRKLVRIADMLAVLDRDAGTVTNT